jgi:glycosyl transferase family 25
MQIFVINLPSSPDRRQDCQQELDRHNLSANFFDAWTGEQALRNNLFRYNDRKFAIRTGASASNGQMGCFASHLVLWKKCVELNESILVLEDDFRIQKNFHQCYDFVESHIDNLGLVRFHSADVEGLPVLAQGKNTIRLLNKAPMMTLAYAVSPRGAQHLIDGFDEFIEPIDFYMKRFWITRQPVYQVTPDPVRHSDLADETTIANPNVVRKTFELRLARLLDQIKNSTLRKITYFMLRIRTHKLKRSAQ